MPLTKQGQSILRSMRATDGTKKGTPIVHASRNKGTITGVEKRCVTNPNVADLHA